MKIYFLENSLLKVSISTKGAELENIYNKETQLEYLWNGDANFWPKKSPVLFPIVGGLKNGEYEFSDIKYKLGRHGFTREFDFEVAFSSAEKIIFSLSSNEITKQVYPFDFILFVEYEIIENKLICTYKIENNSNNILYFSIGAHPAFNIPLTNNTNYNDWFLAFGTNENAGLYPLNTEGLIVQKSIPFFNNTNKIKLSKELFYNDALIFKDLKSSTIKIESEKSNNGILMEFNNFPYYGIWSAKNANFVCLEPWCGISDTEDSDGKLINKEGINTLQPNETFTRNWSVILY